MWFARKMQKYGDAFSKSSSICEKLSLCDDREPTEMNMASHERRQVEESMCEFEASRLNTLRENRHF